MEPQFLIRITPNYSKRWLLLIVSLLMLVFFLRSYESLAMPAYADESHHIRRAEVAWEFTVDPVASTQPGKLMLYYYLGLFEVERTDYLQISRIAVALFTILGGAATYAIGKHLCDARIGMMALLLYATQPYLLFFDRIALADPLALSTFLVAIWAILIWSQNPRPRTALIVGLAMLFPPFAKLTAMGIIGVPFLTVVLFQPRENWRRYLPSLPMIYGIFALVWVPLFTPTVISQLTEEEDSEKIVLVGDYLLNIHEEEQGFVENLLDNIRIAFEQTAIYYWLPALLLTGLLWLVLLRYQTRIALFLAGLFVVAWLPAIAVGSFPRGRYLEIGIPFLILIFVSGAYEMLPRIPDFDRRETIERAVMFAFVLYSMGWGLAFWQTAVTTPETLDIPEADRWRYMESGTSGYGHREAASYLESNFDELEIYGILGSCHLIRLYLPENIGIHLTCAAFVITGGQALRQDVEENIVQSADEHDLYVLLERSLQTDFDALPFEWEFVEIFPRPHEGVALELWRVEIAEGDEFGFPALPD